MINATQISVLDSAAVVVDRFYRLRRSTRSL